MYSLAFSFTSLIYLIIIALIYYAKQRLNNLSSKIYKLLIYTSCCTAFLEICYVIVFNFNLISFAKVLLILYYVFVILFLGLVFIYINSFISKDTVKSNKIVDLISKVRRNTFCIIFCSLFIILGFIIVLMSNIKGDMNVFPEYAIGFGILLILCSFGLFIYDAYVIRFNPNVNGTRNLSIALFVLFIFFVAQVLFNNTTLIAFGFTLFLFLLYITYENPDIQIIDEIGLVKDDIMRSTQTKSDFLTNMSYEIKYPMDIVNSCVMELMDARDTDIKLVSNDLKLIIESGYNMIDIVNNVLEISRIETGSLVLNERKYKISDVVANMIDSVKKKIGDKKIKIVVNVDQNISSILLGDVDKIQQALVSIINNAAIYTEVGRIVITITSTKNVNNEKLLFKISDTGIGIKEADKVNLFKKGSSFDINNEIGGSGFGLTIAKDYINFLDGKVWFESEYRVGTTFYVEVTQKIIDATPIGVNGIVSKAVVDFDCSKFKILVVDDDEFNIKATCRLLQTYNFNISSVNSGIECIDLIKKEEEYDLILMDYIMPEVNGIETLHILKSFEGYNIPPIVCLTGNVLSDIKETYIKEGFDDYLAKPINVNELNRIIVKFLKNKKK